MQINKRQQKTSHVSMQQKQYICQILKILKFVSFHELYMEKQRQSLALNQLYDPLTAFKALDAFNSGQIIAYELRSFFDKYNLKTTDLQCQKVLQSLHKDLIRFNYDDFQQLTLPKSSTIRNKSLTRYKSIKIEVGSMGKIYEIKKTSANKIATFLYKQIEFERQLYLNMRRFCQKYGGDLYSFSQIYLKSKTEVLEYLSFYEISRQYDYFFNKEEFEAIYLRTKSISCSFSEGQRLKIQPKLTIKMLSSILHTNQLDIKKQISRNVPQCQNLVQKPSYKINVYLRQKQFKDNEDLQKRMNIISKIKNSDNNYKRLKFNYSKPQYHFHPKNNHEFYVQQQQQWLNQVNSMSPQQINIRYKLINQKNNRYL